ncbi:MAG TPA: response regulator [Stenomitos sp.]
MATQEVITTAELAKQILACSEQGFTGQLDLAIQEPKAQRWSLYFRQGHLIWGADEIHPIRRLLRQLSMYCPQLVIDSHALANLCTQRKLPTRVSTISQKAVQPQDGDYRFLVELMKQGKLRRSQMTAIMEGYIKEVLFDIHQRWDRFRYRSALQLTYRPIPPDILNSFDATLISIQVEPIWQQALQAWQAWQQDALAEVSPNLAPAISKAEELRWQTSPKVYQNLITLVDGHQTFRDLAVKLKQNLLPLTLSIMPYIRKGLIEVLEVEDVNYAVKPTTHPQSASIGSRVRPVQSQPTSPLIAYIDDSQIDCQRMNHILVQAGYRCILIQDPVQALPLLLEHKPDLIFLDLIMPVTNGYEICSQVRRISVFQDTPVIILTSNDGIVDRVRAKMVGSTGFLAKPIGREKVLSILQKYLALTKSAPS